MRVEVWKVCWGIQRLQQAQGLHSGIHWWLSRAVVSNVLCSKHPGCWWDSVTLLIIPLSAAESKCSIARGRWRSLAVRVQNKHIKGQLCILAVLVCHHPTQLYTARSRVAAVSAGRCMNAMFMNYLSVISVHRKLNKRMCLSTSVAEVNKGTEKSFDGCKGWGGGNLWARLGEYKQLFLSQVIDDVAILN